MKKKVAISIFITLLIIAIPVHSANAGWKENYRNKYSKKTLDPNSEKAKKIRSLCNFDFKYPKWKKSAREKGNQNVETRRSLSAQLMPWKEKKESKDKFEGYTTNFSVSGKDAPETKEKTGNTLAGCIRSVGDEVLEEINKSIKKSE